MRGFPLAVAVAGLALGGTAARPAPRVEYRQTMAVLLGAPDRWDYLVFDPPSHRVYVAHGDSVSVVDGRSGTRLGEVRGAAGGTHGIAVSHATGTGYTDDGRAGTAIGFDLATLAVTARIPVAKDADAIVFDAASGHLFVVAGDPGKVSVVDPRSRTVVATIAGGGKLETAVGDDLGKLYVNGEANKEIVRIDTRRNAVDARWPIPSCTSPHGLAIDVAARRLFVSCKNAVLVVVESVSGKALATLPIGRGSDAAAFDPKRNLAFSSNGLDGTLSVIRGEKDGTYVPSATIKTAVSGRTMAIDPATGRLYIAAADVVPSPTPGARPRPRPGTLKLLIFDPVP